jgi:hypothetical protein
MQLPEWSGTDFNESDSVEAPQRTESAEWTGKHQGFLEKRSNSRLAFFGERWKLQW